MRLSSPSFSSWSMKSLRSLYFMLCSVSGLRYYGVRVVLDCLLALVSPGSGVGTRLGALQNQRAQILWTALSGASSGDRVLPGMARPSPQGWVHGVSPEEAPGNARPRKSEAHRNQYQRRFMDWKNSSLVLVSRSLSSRNSSDAVSSSMECNSLRRIHTRWMSASVIGRSSRRVPERRMLMAG